MSLAIYAAPFNDTSNNNDNYDNLINKKKQAHNKTQKKYPKEIFDMEKVNSVLDKIHNSLKDEDDEKNTLGDFNPPPMPQSAGVTRTSHTTEHMQNMTNKNNDLMFRTLGKGPEPIYDASDKLDLNSYSNYGDTKTVEDYYKNVLPNYKHSVNKPYYNVTNISSNDNPNNDVLMQKLNYMINLLEEQQDEKTNNVTEEVVLYSFLGIFIIFVVDSFARVGKYVR